MCIYLRYCETMETGSYQWWDHRKDLPSKSWTKDLTNCGHDPWRSLRDSGSPTMEYHPSRVDWDSGFDFYNPGDPVETIDSSVGTEEPAPILWNKLRKFLRSLIASKVFLLIEHWSMQLAVFHMPRDHLCHPFLRGKTNFTDVRVESLVFKPTSWKEASQTIQKSPSKKIIWRRNFLSCISMRIKWLVDTFCANHAFYLHDHPSQELPK